VLIIEFLLLYPFRGAAEKAIASISAEVLFFQGPAAKLLFAAALVYVLYFALFERALGQTIGKMLMKITSVTLENRQMSFWQALGRNLFLLPFVPFIFLWAIDPVFIMLKKRSLSETFTKTKTVEGEKWLEKSKQL